MLASVAQHLVRRARRFGARVVLAAGIAATAVAGQAFDASAQATTPIRNIATADYEINGRPQPEIVSNPAIFYLRTGNTDGDIEIMQSSDASGSADSATLGKTEFSKTCTEDGNFSTGSLPVIAPDGSFVDTSGPVGVESTETFYSGTSLVLRVTDADANLDPASIESVIVVLTVSNTGDQETLRLYETAPDSGIFIGYVPTTDEAVGNPCDGILSVLSDSVVEATYRDSLDPTDIATDSASVISFWTTVAVGSGRVFESSTGQLVDGAQVTLIDASTGLPATVTSTVTGTSYPSTVMSGHEAVDGDGTVHDFAEGEFRFPIVSAGMYYLRVEPPQAYQAPSVVPDPMLQLLPGAPWAVTPGGRGEMFEMTAGGSIRVDIPLDIPTNLLLLKTTQQAVAAIGDFVRYELTLRNLSGAATPPLEVTDELPEGFRYQEGSLRINGEPAEAKVSANGRTLTFLAPPLPESGRAQIAYVVEVTVGARPGDAINKAYAYGEGGYSSNVAEVEVRVSDPFMRDSTTIVGRISAQACDLAEPWPRKIVEGESVPGVRIYMEDGRYAVTDEDGLYHFEGVKPGVHVVQVDTITLPDGYEPVLCEENTRFAGTPHSQMVDLKGGSLWRADFYLKRTRATPVPAGDELTKADAVSADEPAEPETADPETSAELVEKYDVDWLATQNADVEWVYPDPEAGVPFPGVKFAIKHPADQEISVFVDGKPVSPKHIAAMTRSADRKLAITHWRGVDIRKGANRFTVIATTKDGRETARFERVIHFVTEVERIRFAPEHSRLVADGRTPPEIAFQVTDGAGRPVHRGRVIDVDVEPPYRALSSKERYDARPLTETFAARGGAVAGNNGIAILRLEPTLRSGVVRVNVKLDSEDVEDPGKTIEAWLEPEQREWILVGLAEGTVGLKTVSGNMKGGKGDGDISTDGRVAFFAKGTIKGEWLLTISLDTDRKRGKRDENVFRQIDPNAYYTLYGDNSEQDYEAESSYPLYVKLERKNFYAMFGDYDTGLGKTELARYDRRLSGIKAAYRDETFDVVAFGASTNQLFVKDEVLSNGTSGPYRLQAAPLVRNSETVVVETRDRFRNDIILATQRLVRYLDYNIDYQTGVITLRQPVPVTDFELNPNIFVFEYETVNPARRKLTYGGRASVRLADDRVEVGASYVHEGGALGRPDSETDLGGVDLRVNLTENTELRAEYAMSSTKDGGETTDGKAIFAELTHSSDKLTASAHFRQEDSGFGVGQLSTATGGFRRYGGDVEYVLREAGRDELFAGTTTLNFEAFREELLDQDATRTVAEGAIRHGARNWDVALGVRHLDYAGSAQEDSSVTQIFSNGRYNFETIPLSLYTAEEFAISGSSDVDFDNRVMVGADYQLTEWLTSTASYEYSKGADLGMQNVRAGLTASPWTGATISAAAQNQMGMDESGDRLSAVFGVGQTVRLTDKFSISGNVEHQRLLSGEPFELPTSPFTTALIAEEYTVGSIGLGYVEEDWSASARAEARIDDEETRFALNVGLAGDLTEDLSMASWLSASETRPDNGAGKSRQADLSLAAAYRPLDQGPIYLNRLDLSYADDPYYGTSFKAVDNFTSNFRLGDRGQASLHLGAKYALQEFDGAKYDGFSYFAGGELRYDVAPKFDIGLHGAVAHSLNSGILDYAMGASIGYNVFDNAWVSLGYNFDGLDDDDFGGANYWSHGPFIQFRLNFDQDTLRGALNTLRGR